LDQSEPIPAQLDPSWSYLGTFLGQLGAVLGCSLPSWSHLGSKNFLEPHPKNNVPQLKNSGVSNLFFCYLWSKVCDNFLDTFGATFGAMLGTILGQIWERRSHDGSKRSIKSCQGQRTNISKDLKTPLVFFNIFVVLGHPRQPQKAQDGSQEAPKELQNVKKDIQKSSPHLSQFSQF